MYTLAGMILTLAYIVLTAVAILAALYVIVPTVYRRRTRKDS